MGLANASFLCFDTETGGVDTFSDRVVQLFMATADKDGNLIDTWEWVINPGVEIAEEASEVHGYTNEFLAEHGLDPVQAFTEAKDVFARHLDIPWVAFNLVFDLTILDSEFKRHGISEKFGDYAAGNVRLIDGLVIDRAKDKYRKGPRKLSFMADHYGVDYNAEDLHDARADVELTAKVTVKILEKFGTPTTAEQARWQEDWRSGFERYLQKSDPNATVERGWPLREKEEEK